MEINRENYEVYALDYIEGNLSTSELKAFEVFLSNNADIRNLLTNFYVLNVTPNQEIIFENKSALLRGKKILRPTFYWISQAAVIILLITAGLFIGLHQWNGSNISNVLVESPSADPINKTSSQLPDIREDSQASKVTPVAHRDVPKQVQASSRRIITEHKKGDISMANDKVEIIAISDATWSQELIIDQKMVHQKRNVQSVALLPMRSITPVPAEYEDEYEIDLTAPKFDLNTKNRPTRFSGLFANLDLVPERFDKVETSDVKSKFLPRSYFNK